MKPITGLKLLNFLKTIPEEELSTMEVFIQNYYLDSVVTTPEIRTFKNTKEKGLIFYPWDDV